MTFSSRSEAAFTGLEAAIVLIAFVVVAAVFSYVMLSAGFFATEKAQSTVHNSVVQSSSSLMLIGNVYGEADPGNPYFTWVIFTVGLSPGGTPINFDNVTIVYSNATQLVTLSQGIRLDPQPGTNLWTIAEVQNQPGAPNDILEPGEQFTIVCNVDTGIYANDNFNIEVRPPVGTAFTITRTAPPEIAQYSNLY